MKRLLIASALVALALPGLAQEADDFAIGEITVGVQQTDSDTISSKFMEYRDLPEGAVVPFLRFKGKNGDFWYDFYGQDVREDDQRFGLRIDTKNIKIDGSYYRVPHSFGNGGKSLLTNTDPGVFEMSDTLQQAFQDTLVANQSQVNFNFLAGLVQPSLDAAGLVDLKLSRERGNLSFKIEPDGKPVSVELIYFRERRTGTRAAAGTSFGFGNVVETPEALHYLTQDFGINGALRGDWGVARAGVHFNTFENRIETQAWDNPFRFTDSTDGSAYTGPSSRTVNGAATGLMSLPPDNEAVTGSLGATFKLGADTRLTADVAIGSWKQNETPFIGYTTNTSIELPALPASKLDGKIDTLSLSGFFTTRLADNFRLNARFRRYDLDNKTPRVRFEHGYVRFDAVLEDIPRITVPYGYTNDQFEGGVSYAFDKATIEAGYKYIGMERTFRDTEKTTQNGFFAKLDVHGSDWVMLRGSYERNSRDFDAYDTEHSEEQSFLEPEGPANQLILRRPDQAKKDQDRFGASLQIAPPSGKVTVVVAYFYTKDDYDDSPVHNEITGNNEAPLGLMESKYQTFSADLNVMPNDKVDLYAFYSHEKIDDLQLGRQSGATLSTSQLDSWTSMVADKVDTFGAGANFVLVPDKWNLDVLARYQKVDGFNDLSSPPGGTPDTGTSIDLFDDTKLLTLSAKLTYDLSEAWRFAVGGLFEDYEIQDAQTGGILNYMPGSFFLAANDGDYQAKVGYLQVSYRW